MRTVNSKAIGAALKATREKLGLNGVTMARFLSISSSKLNDLESGRRLPGTEVLSRFRSATGADLNPIIDAGLSDVNKPGYRMESGIRQPEDRAPNGHADR